MNKPPTMTIKLVQEENQSRKGPGSALEVRVDTTKGHRGDEKHNIREQAARGNLVPQRVRREQSRIRRVLRIN